MTKPKTWRNLLIVHIVPSISQDTKRRVSICISNFHISLKHSSMTNGPDEIVPQYYRTSFPSFIQTLNTDFKLLPNSSVDSMGVGLRLSGTSEPQVEYIYHCVHTIVCINLYQNFNPNLNAENQLLWSIWNDKGKWEERI